MTAYLRNIGGKVCCLLVTLFFYTKASIELFETQDMMKKV